MHAVLRRGGKKDKARRLKGGQQQAYAALPEPVEKPGIHRGDNGRTQYIQSGHEPPCSPVLIQMVKGKDYAQADHSHRHAGNSRSSTECRRAGQGKYLQVR